MSTQDVPPQTEEKVVVEPSSAGALVVQEEGAVTEVTTESRSPKRSQEVSVVAATVAADLKIVTEVANQITLTVMNAKVVATRAGEEGRAFKPITEFVSTLAQETSQVVGQINKQVVVVAHAAMEENNARRMAEAIKRAVAIHGKGSGEFQLEQWEEEYSSIRASKHKVLAESVRRLLNALEAIEYQVRSAQCISSNCRIEAANVLSYRQDFETVAASVEAAAQRMRQQVSACRQQLEFCLNSQLEVGM